jgi:hypothetical protein
VESDASASLLAPFLAAVLSPAMVAWGGGAVFRRWESLEVAGALPIRCVSAVPIDGLPLCLFLPLLFRPALVARGRGSGWSGEQPAPRSSSSAASAARALLRQPLPTWPAVAARRWLRVCSTKLAAVAASSRAFGDSALPGVRPATATCCRRYPRPQGWSRLARRVSLRELIPLCEDLLLLVDGARKLLMATN